MKFHLTAILTNIIVIFGIMHIYAFFLTYVDNMYFVKKGQYFESYLAYSILFFSWLATFTIYKNHEYKTHYYYFILVNILALIIIAVYKYISFITDNNSFQFKTYDLITSLKSAFLEVIIPLIIISISINIFQNIIGKKLLPTMYKNNKG